MYVPVQDQKWAMFNRQGVHSPSPLYSKMIKLKIIKMMNFTLGPQETYRFNALDNLKLPGDWPPLNYGGKRK